jgi:hypothetical protein
MREERRVAIVICPLQIANMLKSVAFGMNQTKQLANIYNSEG